MGAERSILHVFEASCAADSVDRGAGIVRGVKLLGFDSLHGRTYTPKTAREAAPIYEGAEVCLNHAGGSTNRKRDVRDKVGVIHNPRFVEGQGVFGDVHLVNPASEFSTSFMNAAGSNDPAMHRLYPFSHDAKIVSRPDSKSGKQIVEAIDVVDSVDIVPRGATTKGIREGYDMVPPIDGEEDDKPYHHHVGKAMHAIATHPTMHPEAKKAKTGHLMKALHGTGLDEPMEGETLGDKGDEPDPEISEKDEGKKKRPAEGGEMEPAPSSKGGSFKEGADDMSELEQLRLEKRIRTTADSLGVAVDDAFLAECVQEGFDEAIPKLAERQKKQRAREAARPRSVSRQQLQPVQESADEPSLLKWAPGARGRMVRP